MILLLSCQHFTFSATFRMFCPAHIMIIWYLLPVFCGHLACRTLGLHVGAVRWASKRVPIISRMLLA